MLKLCFLVDAISVARTHTHSSVHLANFLAQGQNHITALSRAFYFIFVGMIAFFINLALVEIGESFPPLCVYGFNINSQSVLIFVRDGLLSKSTKITFLEVEGGEILGMGQNILVQF